MVPGLIREFIGKFSAIKSIKNIFPAVMRSLPHEKDI